MRYGGQKNPKLFAPIQRTHQLSIPGSSSNNRRNLSSFYGGTNRNSVASSNVNQLQNQDLSVSNLLYKRNGQSQVHLGQKSQAATVASPMDKVPFMEHERASTSSKSRRFLGQTSSRVSPTSQAQQHQAPEHNPETAAQIASASPKNVRKLRPYLNQMAGQKRQNVT